MLMEEKSYKDSFLKIDTLRKYTVTCPFDSNILHFTGYPERTLVDGYYGAKCRMCQRYYKIPQE